MTARKSGSAALFLVGCVCSGRTVCLLLGAGLSVASLLHGQAVFPESVSGRGFPQLWVGHGGQVFCLCLSLLSASLPHLGLVQFDPVHPVMGSAAPETG